MEHRADVVMDGRSENIQQSQEVEEWNLKDVGQEMSCAIGDVENDRNNVTEEEPIEVNDVQRIIDYSSESMCH